MSRIRECLTVNRKRWQWTINVPDRAADEWSMNYDGIMCVHSGAFGDDILRSGIHGLYFWK